MRILLVEDHQRLADFMRKGLEAAGFDIDTTNTVDEASAALHSGDYDAMVLDLGLPDGDGLDLVRDLRRQGDPLPVLVVTARVQVTDRVHGLDAGADDYLTKPFAMDELTARLRALLRRPAAAINPVLSCGNVSLQVNAREVTVGDTLLALSPRETSLLEHLLRRGGKVVNKTALENGIYGPFREMTPNSLEVMVHRLRRKLEGAGASTSIHTVRGVGYMIIAEQDF